MQGQMKKKSILRSDDGMVLVVALLLLAVLVIMGTTAIMAVSTDIKIAGNYRQSQVALYNAEAGVEHVIAYLRTNTVTYPTTSNPTTAITLSCPTGYNFNTSVAIQYVAANKYKFRMTGTGANNSSKTIETYIRKDSIIPPNVDGAVAMYGGGPEVALKNGANPHENYAIDGQDYPIDFPSDCNGSECETEPDTTKLALPGLYTVMEPEITGTESYLHGNPDKTMGESHEVQWNNFVELRHCEQSLPDHDGHAGRTQGHSHSQWIHSEWYLQRCGHNHC